MNDPAVNRLRRAVEDSRCATGMQAGPPQIRVDRADAERVLRLLDQFERESDGRADDIAPLLERAVAYAKEGEANQIPFLYACAQRIRRMLSNTFGRDGVYVVRDGRSYFVGALDDSQTYVSISRGTRPGESEAGFMTFETDGTIELSATLVDPQTRES